MEIRPIHSEADHDAALAEIERLFHAEPGTDDGDKVEVLVALVETYERRIYSTPHVPPLEVLKFMMEQNDRTQSDLSRLLGSRSRASEILNGKRALTLDQIRLLAREWHIPAATLVGELETA